MPRKRKGPNGLYKRPGSPYWWCRFWVDGKEVRKSTRTTDRRKAQIEARRLRVEHEQANPAPVGRGARLTELAAADIKCSEDNGCTESHIKSLETMWGALLRHFGANYLAASVTYDGLQTYVGMRRRKGVRGQSIRRELAALKRGLLIAFRRGQLQSVLDEWPKVRRDPPHPKRKGKLVAPEIIHAILGEVSEEVRDELLFITLTGVRATEAKRAEASWVEPLPKG
ncbi:hypothetical protein ACFL6C_14080, partial [Myxococcota bacterium]